MRSTSSVLQIVSFRRRSTVLLALFTWAFCEVVAQNPQVEDNYVLTAGDEIAVEVFGQEDLETVQEISNKGTINLGLIGSIQVSGMNLEEAENKIRKAYIDQRFLRDPQIIMGVREYSPKLVSVLGQVNKPGSVQLPKDTNHMPLARVISMVGGFRGIAKTDSIRVVRKDPLGAENTIIVDMSDIGKAKGDRPDIGFLIYPDDVIYVPERIF